MCARSLARSAKKEPFLVRQTERVSIMLSFFFCSFAAAATALPPLFARFCLFASDYLFVQRAEAYAIDVFVHVH